MQLNFRSLLARSSALLLALPILLVPTAALADGDQAKYDAGVAAALAAGTQGQVPVVCRYSAKYSGNDALNALISLVKQLGGTFGSILPEIQSCTCTVPGSGLRTLLAQESIERVSLDAGMAPYLATTTGAVGAPTVWKSYGYDGKGVTIAVIDSGIFPHEDLTDDTGLRSRIIAWKDWVNGLPAPYDDFGHGTHVAGILAGNGRAAARLGMGVSYKGLAPRANLIGLKVLDRNGQGSVGKVIDALL